MRNIAVTNPSIRNAEAVMEELKKNADCDEQLVITVNADEAIDITFIQMIESLRKTRERDGKTTVVKISCSKELETLLTNNGFNKYLL